MSNIQKNQPEKIQISKHYPGAYICGKHSIFTFPEESNAVIFVKGRNVY